MSVSRRLLWGMGLALVFLAGVGFEKAFAQPQQKLDWMQAEATLPPDVHPETLSRMPRSKESDFTNDDDKAAFARANRRGNGNAETVQRWLGPTETRMADPVYAEAVESVGRAAHSKQNGVDPRYYELTVAVVTRESGNREEFINHEEDAIKTYGQELEDVVRLRKDTKGLDPKDAAIIEFGRELFKLPRTEPVSSKAFADMEKNFGRRGALSIAAVMCYYDTNYMLMRVYDQHMDTSPECKGGHRGCLDLKNPPPAW
jgi:hypothetical protein